MAEEKGWEFFLRVQIGNILLTLIHIQLIFCFYHVLTHSSLPTNVKLAILSNECAY